MQAASVRLQASQRQSPRRRVWPLTRSQPPARSPPRVVGTLSYLCSFGGVTRRSSFPGFSRMNTPLPPFHLTLKSYSIEVVVAEFGLCSPIPRPRSRMHVFRIARSSHVNTMRCDVAMSIPHPFARARARTFHSPLAYPFQRKQPSAPNMHVVIRLHLSPPRACPPLLAHGSYCRRHSQAVRPRCSCGLGTCTVCIATSVRRLPGGLVGLGAFSNSSMPTQHSPAPHTPVSPVSSVR